MLLFTYIGGTYVFTLLVSVPIGLCKTIMNVEVETNVETNFDNRKTSNVTTLLGKVAIKCV